MLSDAHLSYTQYIRSSTERVRLPQQRRATGKLNFEMMIFELDSHELEFPDVPELLLSMPLDIVDRSAWCWEIAGDRREESFRLEKMLMLPPCSGGRWRATGRRKQLFLVVPPATMNRAVGLACLPEVNDALAPLRLAGWEDPFLRMMMMELWGRLDCQQSIARLFTDGALITILAQLLHRAGTSTNLGSVALPARKLRLVQDYIEANLATPVDLLSLAELVGLSPRHFTRVFQRETGEAPYQYIMARRLERAKSLIQQGCGSLQEVARNSGFADQSHLTRSMKKGMGITPARWKRIVAATN